MQLLVYKRDYIKTESYQKGDIIETRNNSFWLLNNGSVQQWDKTAFYVIQIDDLVKTKALDDEMTMEDKVVSAGTTIFNRRRLAGIDLTLLLNDYPSLATNGYISMVEKDFKKYYIKSK